MNDNLKERVYGFIKSSGKDVSFVELERAFPEFSGDEDFGLLDKNIIFWSGISEEFADVLKDLIKERKITFQRVNAVIYVMDGKLFHLPIAKSLKRNYKDLRWFPVALNIVKLEKKG